MLDNLTRELFLYSPTFRQQVSDAFTDVALERWKAAEATVASVDALIAAGQATPQQLIAQKYARTEASFLRKAMAIQGIYLDPSDQPPPGFNTSTNEVEAKEGISKLINQMLGSPRSTWTWTIDDWMTNQQGATLEIAARLDDLLATMVAAPVGISQQVQEAAAALPAAPAPGRMNI